jgi:HK97 family phage portal protein
MSFLSILGAEVKALHKLTEHKLNGPRDMFARTSSFGLGSSLVSQSNSLDFERMASDPLHNSVVAACVNAIARALPDAPLVLENRTSGGWKAVEDHPCLEVLRAPNPDHSDADVWGLTSGYKATRGQAFWLLLPNWRGEVGEIHVWNPDRVTVLGDEEQFISGYRVQRESGTHFVADKRQIIHFRHLPDFTNPRLGWSPLGTGRAQIAGDNVAASYHTSILFNAGVVSLLISLKEGAMSGQVTPEQFQTVLTNLRRAGRERSGGIEGINLPLEVHKLAYSPDEMNVDKLIEYYETRICCVMGVSQRVAGLGSDPTYNNLSEALNDLWERRIVPDRNADAATLNRQWLPLWGLEDGTWRFRFDYSNVPALQENRDALHARVRSDFEKGLVDKQQARALLGYATDNDGEFARVFYGEKPKTQTDAFKAWDESRHPRDEDGRFAGGTSHSQGGQTSRLSGIARSEVINNSGGSSGENTSGGSVSGSHDVVPPRTFVRRPPPKGNGIDAEKYLHDLLAKNSNLSPDNYRDFSASLSKLVRNIPAHLHSRLTDNIMGIESFNGVPVLRKFAEHNWGMSHDNASKMLGAWHYEKWKLLLDGEDEELGPGEIGLDRDEIYAHELTHVLDLTHDEVISLSKEWNDAYTSDIGKFSTLSPYAATSPTEGFAELGRLIYSANNPKLAVAYYREYAPECMKVWEKRGLLP